MNITFDQSDVEQMAASFKSWLSEAVKHFPSSPDGKRARRALSFTE